MVKNSIGFVFHSGAIVLLTIAAFCQLYWVGKWRAVLFIAMSGAGTAAGMRSGIEKAPEKNWNRQLTKIQSVLVYMLIFGVMSIPSAIVGVLAGIFVDTFVGVASAISSLWLSCFAVACTLKLMKWWIGPVKDPRDVSKNN